MILANLDLQTTNSKVFIYQVPDSFQVTLTINIVNRNASQEAHVRVAFPPSGTFDDSWWVEYDTPVLPKDRLMIPGVPLQAGDNIYIQSDTNNLSIVVYGLKDAVVS